MYAQSPCIPATIALLSILGSGVFASKEFESFVIEFGRKYPSILESSLRREIFLKNKQLIDDFNAEQAEKLGFRLGINEFADRTNEEVSIRRGLKVGSGLRRNSPKAEQFFANLMANVTSSDVPAEVDWRKVPGRVSGVKDQGYCGSCWAFSSTGALEGQMALRAGGKKLVPLSEQNLMDCSPNNSGCNGGSMDAAWADIRTEGGIESEQAYPYEAKNGPCKFNKTKAIFNDKDSFSLKEGDEELLKRTVATFGPVSVGIDSSPYEFTLYVGGIFITSHCGSDLASLDHAVLVVGYGTDAASGLDYWIVKNSWGTKWGEDGYIRMARNKHNVCGIATAAIIPTF